jgi:hypothetical protein
VELARSLDRQFFGRDNLKILGKRVEMAFGAVDQENGKTHVRVVSTSRSL